MYDTNDLLALLDLAQAASDQGSPIRSLEDIFEPEFLQELHRRQEEQPDTVQQLLRGPWRGFESFSDEEGQHWGVVRSSEDPLTAKPVSVFDDRKRAYAVAALLAVIDRLPRHKLEKDDEGYAIQELVPGEGWTTLGHVQEPDENILRTFRLLRAVTMNQEALAQVVEGVRSPKEDDGPN